MIVLIDNYDSFTYNLFQLVACIYPNTRVLRNDELSLSELVAIKPKAFILSPGPKRPKDAANLLPLIQANLGLPILGVCLGMQAIAEAFGGKVRHANKCVHGKAKFIEHSQSDLFENIPDPLKVARYHSLVVCSESLPKSLDVLAKSKQNEIMAIKHSTLPYYGVQFHPESILSEYGKELIQNFLKITYVL